MERDSHRRRDAMIGVDITEPQIHSQRTDIIYLGLMYSGGGRPANAAPDLMLHTYHPLRFRRRTTSLSLYLR
jgi:hypothetical protein